MMAIVTKQGVRYGMVLRVPNMLTGMSEIAAVLTDLGFDNAQAWDPRNSKLPASFPPDAFGPFVAPFPSFLCWAEADWNHPPKEILEDQGMFEILALLPLRLPDAPAPTPPTAPAGMSVAGAAIFGITLLVGTLIAVRAYARR